MTISGQRENSTWPAQTTPHTKAHIGGNHVTGFSNSNVAITREAGIGIARVAGWSMGVI